MRMVSTNIDFLWIHVPHEACLNVASVSGHASAAQAVFQVAKAGLLFQASAIWRLLHGVMDVAEVKVSAMLVTLAMFHVGKPVPVNLDAPLNVCCSVVTLATFHPLRSEFISLAV